jgi:hypothetical protein
MKSLTDQQLTRMREIFVLFAEADKVAKECNRVYEFTCPICGQTASTARAGNVMRSRHFCFACQIASPVVTPNFFAIAFFVRIIPCLCSVSPATATGLSRRSGLYKSSTEA